jgi:hypothetical protein
LTTAVLFRHLKDVIHYIHFAAPIRDVDKITRERAWRNAFSDAFGNSAYEQVRPWLKRIARPERQSLSKYESILNWSRAQYSVLALWGNVKSMLLQPISLTSAVTELGVLDSLLPWRGPYWMAKSFKRFGSNPLEMIKRINTLSPYLRQRMSNFDREISDAIAKHSKTHGWLRIKTKDHDYTLKDVQDAGMAIYGMADAVGVYPAWLAAYMQATHKMAKGDARFKSDADCVAYADNLTRQVMPGAQSVDLSTFQGSTGWTRLFTAFLTPQFRYGSRMQAYYRGWRQGRVPLKTFVTHWVAEGLLPPLIFTSAAHLLTSGEPPDVWEILEAEVSWPVSWVPIVGTLLSSASAQRRTSISVPATQLFERGGRLYSAMFRGAKAEAEGKPAEKIWLQAAMAGADVAEFFLGLPLVSRGEIFAQGLSDLEKGKTDNPLRLFIRAAKEHQK